MISFSKTTISIATLLLATAFAGAGEYGAHTAQSREAVVYVKDDGNSHRSSMETEVSPRLDQATARGKASLQQVVAPHAAEAFMGDWRGEMPMVSHTHPITFKATKTGDGVLTATFNVMGMDTRALENMPSEDVRFSIRGNSFSFLLAGDGVRFDGELVSETEIAGTLDWMGRQQAMSFFKSDTAEDKPKTMQHHMGSGDKMNVAILVFDGVDVLDWAGPMEVFVNSHAFNAYTVAAENRAYAGMGHKLYPEYTFADMPEPDILIVPGGSVAALMHQQETIEWIRKTSAKSDITMSVCNGVITLAGTSMLKGLEATTHGAWMEWLTAMAGEQNFSAVRGPRFVDNGKIVTTAGVSSGIDGALHLVARLKGLRVARMAARNMEYDWTPSDISQYEETNGS